MRLLVIILICLSNVSCSQVAGSLRLEIKNDSVQIFNSEEIIKLSLKCTNEEKSDLLLYGFEGSMRGTSVDFETICNLDKKGARFVVFIFDEKNIVRHPIFGIENDYKPMPDQKLAEILKKHRLKFINEVKLIKAFETIDFIKEINLKDYNLEKGKYQIQIVYVSGNAVKALVGKEQLEQDQLIHGAELYRGCVMSNKIKVVVN